MDLYARLAKDLGISRVEAKRRAFVAAYSAQSDLSPVGQLLHQYAKEAMMTDTLSQSSHLNSLGSEKTDYVYSGVDKKLLETFPNPMTGLDKNCTATIEIVAPEFTSLCPKTGQPDFATIVVHYAPRELCVESKSFKLYLGSFRQAGEFHEACVTRIANDLIELLKPKWLEVEGQFTPRGGIRFWPKVHYHGSDSDLIDNGGF